MKDIYRTKRWNKGLEEGGGAKEGEEKRRTPTAEQRSARKRMLKHSERIPGVESS